MPEVGILFLIPKAFVRGSEVLNKGLNARGGHFVFNTRLFYGFSYFIAKVLMPEVGILFLIRSVRGINLSMQY